MPAKIHLARHKVGIQRVIIGIIASILAVALTVPPGSAYWSSTGTLSATTVTGTLAPPEDVQVTSATAGEVDVVWSRGIGPLDPTGYYITRDNGGAISPACGSNPDQLITDTLCTDTAVPPDDYTYTVTAAFQTWTAVSTPSEPVTVAEPSLLGAAANFSILAGTMVTNTGATSVSGDVGVSPGTAIVGFGPGTAGGDLHSNDAAAVAAQVALDSAFTELAGRPADAAIVDDLVGQVLTAGTYSSIAALALTGNVTLDGEGDPNAVFIFQAGAAFNTAAGATVTLIDGAQAHNVYWVVTGAAGTGASSNLAGTILARGAITLGAGTALIGRALSRDAVTLASNSVRFTEALPPTIAIDGGPSTSTRDISPTITGTTNSAPASPITVTIAGQTLTTVVGAGGVWSVTAGDLAAGQYSIVAKVRDSAGNGNSTTQTLTVVVNPAPIAVGTASSFSVLAATSITNTGATALSGDLGISPSTAVAGFPPGTYGGTLHAGNPTAATAQADLATAYTDAANRAPHTNVVGDLGGQTFRVGIHRTIGAMSLTGTVTLDGEGDPNATFIFQAGAAFNTAAGASVALINGAQAHNVYWVATGAAGAGATSHLSGTILAQGAITLGAGTTLIGQALSLDAVTLADNTVRFTEALPPSIAIDGGPSITTTDTTPTVTGTTSAAPTSPVTVTIADQTLTTTVGSGGAWAVTAADLPAGQHTILAKVKDNSGNGNSATATVTVVVNPAPISLGTASTFSVLAATSITNTGATMLSGDVGISPSTAVAGFPPGTYGGALHAGDPTAAAAQADLLTALDDASSRAPHTIVSGDLGGQTFRVGIHRTIAAMALTGTVTLDGEGDPNATFIFQAGAAFNTAAGASVVLINGAQAQNVYWVVTGAAGTGAGSGLSGTILAQGGITLGEGTTLAGRALSRDAVTLSGNTVTGVDPAE
ncbi:ice-binding family protein [Arthrobacter sp. 260]|uniref:ice-binding family protein n=1 Tax=Arthrobacter sp. 260 TaxID=2735314 RepID=UPI001492D429|nr:ice-binding family protein [Arthrobacter sp. 260]NOJ59855.1 DUF3494 domain-containing protein [Arthrobacter sp. 260]